MGEYLGEGPTVAPDGSELWDDAGGEWTGVDDPAPGTATLGALHEVTRELVRAEDATDVCTLAVAAARDVLGLALSGVHLADAGDLVPVAVTEALVEKYGEVPAITAPDNPAQVAYREETPIVVGETDQYRSVEPAEVPSDGGLVAPLPGHGVFLMTTREERTLTEAELSFALTLAANTRTALEATRREADLERQNERLGTFAEVLSHDLRNPLTMLDGNLELARETGEERYFDRASEAIDRMDDLIEDVLALARSGQAVENPEWVDPEQVAVEAMAECPGDAGEFSVQVPADRLVAADPGRLRQLLGNLFRNAIEHAGPAPEIVVGLDGDVLYVADDGPGIPAAEREAVFEYGYTTADGGSGLGLRIVADLAAAHGWTVAVAESESGGARIEIGSVETGTGS